MMKITYRKSNDKQLRLRFQDDERDLLTTIRLTKTEARQLIRAVRQGFMSKRRVA